MKMRKLLFILLAVCALLGLVLSVIYSTPVGSTIVAVDIVAFLGFFIAGLITGKE